MDTQTRQIPWEPLGDQILVQPLAAADVTAGGLIIPDEHREKPQEGIVIKVGPGLPTELTGITPPATVEIGDLVAFGKYAGIEFNEDKDRFLLMRQVEALARRRKGSFELTSHVDEAGRTHLHDATKRCDRCPKEPTPFLDEERERLRRERLEREGAGTLAEG